jgi:hypothetical protein
VQGGTRSLVIDVVPSFGILPSIVDIPLRKFKMGNKFLASCMSMCTCQITRIPQLSTSFAFTAKPEKK